MIQLGTTFKDVAEKHLEETRHSVSWGNKGWFCNNCPEGHKVKKSRYGWKVRERARHVIERVQERFGILISEEAVADLEAAVNTMVWTDFTKPDENHHQWCMVYFKDQLMRVMSSVPAFPGNPRRVITVVRP